MVRGVRSSEGTKNGGGNKMKIKFVPGRDWGRLELQGGAPPVMTYFVFFKYTNIQIYKIYKKIGKFFENNW